ncbi:MAG: flagellar export protein FliJ [Bdellovibrionales bacterium]
MKFKFPYENILKTKKVSRDVAFRDFAEAKGHLTTAENDLSTMYNLVADTHQLSEDCLKQNLSPRDKIELLKWAQVFHDGQQVKINHQKLEVRKRNQDTEDRRETLAQIAKEYKIFEKLKDKMKEKHKKNVRKLDQKTIDEIVVMQSARKIIERENK